MKKLLKPALLVLLLAGLMAGTALCASAADDGDRITVTTGYSIYIDGTQLDPRDANYDRVEAIAYNGTTYLPVRALCNALGMTDLSYDAATRTVRINKGTGYSSYGFDPLPPQRDVPEKSLEIVTGITVYVNDVKLEPKDAKGNPVEVFAWNGTTYLPVRALCNALGIPAEELHYEERTHSVHIGDYMPMPLLPELTDFLGTEYKKPYSDGYISLGTLAYQENMEQVLEECVALLAEYDLELNGSIHDSWAGLTSWDRSGILAFTYTGSHEVEVWTKSIDSTGEEISGSFFLSYMLWGEDEYVLSCYTNNLYRLVVDGAKVSVDTLAEEEPDDDSSDSQWRETCSACGGDGDCSRCGGDGEVRKLLAGTREWVNQKCTSCRPAGSGKCSSCSGKGYK